MSWQATTFADRNWWWWPPDGGSRQGLMARRFGLGLLVANDVVVSADPRPSYEELAALVGRQADLLATQADLLERATALAEEQAAVIVQLQAKVRELRRQLKLNSRNSSKPLA